MKSRHDALAAAAKLALEIRAIAGKHSDAVCTIGSLKTFPGIATAVVGRCELTLDQRDLRADVLAQMYREAHEASDRFAREEKCTVEWSRMWSIEPIAFHHGADRSLPRSGDRNRRRRPAPALRPPPRCRRSSTRRNPDSNDVRPIARRHQPQQNRKHIGRAPGNGRQSLRSPGHKIHVLDPAPLTHSYCCRSASAGSTPAARRAGQYVLANPAPHNIATPAT